MLTEPLAEALHIGRTQVGNRDLSLSLPAHAGANQRSLYLPLRMNSSEQRMKSNILTVPSSEQVASLASVGDRL